MKSNGTCPGKRDAASFKSKSCFGTCTNTARSRYKRIIYKRIWVASLSFQSAQATFIDIQLNQPSLITRTHCRSSWITGQLQGRVFSRTRFQCVMLWIFDKEMVFDHSTTPRTAVFATALSAPTGPPVGCPPRCARRRPPDGAPAAAAGGWAQLGRETDAPLPL